MTQQQQQVRTVTIRGKAYVDVAERVRLVHDQQKAFEIIESEPREVAGRWIWRAVIKVNGLPYIGNAEIKLDAPRGTPDGTNPFECAETSAVGRALGFAGFGSVESIASLDEMYRAVAREQQPAQRQAQAEQQPAQGELPAAITSQQIESIRKLCVHLSKAEPAGLSQMSYGDAKQIISQLAAEYRALTKK
jgi:hypothetical protein